ncbi:MAG: histidine kinase [Proteobacteria bacterium]|nr:histidine kinase [Pseudomonadota bacterium]
MARNLDPILDEYSETCTLARMRLALVFVAFLGLFIDVPGQSRLEQCLPLAIGAYVAVSISLFVLCERGPHVLIGLRWHWLDLPLYAALVACSGGAHSVYYLFFYFAILSASFHWGWREGVRVTLGAVLLFLGVGLVFVQRAQDASALLGRAALLVLLGLMIAHWGESKLELRRRLALQRRVSNIANPRFGAGQTVQGLLEAVRDYYGASLCLLVLRGEDDSPVSVRLAQQGIALRDSGAIDPDLAASLLPDMPAHLLAFKSLRHPEHWRGAAHDLEQGQWRSLARETGVAIGAVLGAGSFISAPVRLGAAGGRIYVAVRTPRLGRKDALFLHQVTAQALPLIENIEVLDHLATDAASAERQKIAMDLHDSAVQPYIGLRYGLSALRCKADPANPLNEDLDRLIAMSTQVIGDLRSFAQGVRSCAKSEEAQHPLAAALRQQVRLIREFHGVDIQVELEEKDVPCSDRLAAEVLQIVREALSNIVRHTMARHALVQVRCDHGLLRIQVDNEGAANECDFTPKSITARAAALGGRAYVQRAQAGTAVHVEIPV